jgi:GMP synthase-like glutamine amidotransferase
MGIDLLIIEQDDDAPGGYLAEWATDRGHRVHVLRGSEIGASSPDPREYGAIAPLGSEQSVHAPTAPWVRGQVQFLRAAHDAGVPVLGLCFGAQALAAALGADVRLAPRPEIGWFEVEPLDGGDIPPGPWFEWHSDTFAVPPGARELARTPACPQAFALGTSVGLQFHPEATPEIIDGWIRAGRATLAGEGIDPDALAERGHAAGANGRERAYRLFDAIARTWTKRPLSKRPDLS